jgi:hypothetical protein
VEGVDDNGQIGQLGHGPGDCSHVEPCARLPWPSGQDS